MPASRGQLEFLCDQAQGTGFFQDFLNPECKQVLASIGQLEFFYDQAPDVMRSCSMALQLLSVCIGSYLSGALVLGVAQGTAALDPGGAGWLPGDLNDGRLDLFFLLLAGAHLPAVYNQH